MDVHELIQKLKHADAGSAVYIKREDNQIEIVVDVELDTEGVPSLITERL